MNKFVIAAFAAVSAVTLCANPLKGWVPTQGDLLKRKPDAIKAAAADITLKGLPSGKGDWFYFLPSGKKGVFGQKLEIKFTASGKGKVSFGAFEYRSGFSLSASNYKVQQIASDVKEYKVVLTLKGKDTTIVRPVIVLHPESEIKITKYSYNIAGKKAAIADGIANADRSDFLYEVGETAKFTVDVTVDGKKQNDGIAKILYRVNGFFKGGPVSYDLAKGPVKLNVTMNEPGFTVIYLTYTDKNGNVVFRNKQVGAAGFSPLKIKAGRKAPADLLTYWKGQYEKLNKEVPANFKVIRTVKTRTHENKYIVFDNFGGTKSYCAISIPLRRKGKLPMIFTVPPAGNYGHYAFTYPTAIRVTITVFDRLFPTNDHYMKFNRPVWYYIQGAQTRESYYYYKAILGMMRMMDYSMKNVKEWDGKHLAAIGRSQGGGSAFILAALNPKIQCVSADVPALCDHNAKDAKRRAGWPQILSHKTSPSFHKDAEYYDAANFASFIKCPAVVTVGFYDTMCEPASIYAAYNNLKGPKTMINLPRYGHGWGKRASNAFDKPTADLLKKTFAK